MTLSEFTSEKERTIVRRNVIFYFHQYKENWTLIEVSMMGMPNHVNGSHFNDWHEATAVVTDIEAAAIYTNLLEEEGE